MHRYLLPEAHIPLTWDHDRYDMSHIDVTLIITVLCLASQGDLMNRKTISVTGLSCDGCEENVETALQNLDGVTRVDADHEADTVEVVTDDNVVDSDLQTAIEQAGYDIPA